MRLDLILGQCGDNGTPGYSKFESMLVQYWPSVSDSGPALNQHRIDVSCLLVASVTKHASKNNVLSNVGSMLVHLCYTSPTLNQHWVNTTSCLLVSKPTPPGTDRTRNLTLLSIIDQPWLAGFLFIQKVGLDPHQVLSSFLTRTNYF